MTIDVVAVPFPGAVLAFFVTATIAADGVAFAQRAGDEAMGQRARQAFDTDTTMPAREVPEAPSAERLLEQIERTRKAFQTDVTEDAGRETRPDDEQLIEQLQGVREELLGDAAEAAEGGPASEAVVAELRERFGEEFGVEVLDVRAIEADGTPAWAVKVMQPGGNFNAAFRVSTLVVNKESGEVLGELASSIRTGSDVREGGPRLEPGTDERGLQMRRRTYR